MRKILIALLAGVMLLGGPAVAAASTPAPKSASVAAVQTTVAIKAAKAPKLRKLYDYRFTVKKDCTSSIVGCGGRPTVKAHPSKAWAKLKSCFNCVFPVSGAPKKFPGNGQYIKLKACASGIFCKNAPVRYYDRAGYSWQFTAQKGHFDGPGSKVYFKWYQDSNKNLKLRVWAYVASPSVPDSLNKSFAKQTWKKFADNMAKKLCPRTWQCKY
ncbi:hypothetical protein ACX6XY_12805 [Streptomyces sp. O3]